MKITYARPAGEKSVYDYNPDDLLMTEVKLIERTAGNSLEWVEGAVQAGALTERLILLWVLMRRENPHVKLADLEKTIRRPEITVEYTRPERDQMRKRVLDSKSISDEDRERVLAIFDAEDEAENVIDVKPDDEAPKELRAVEAAS